jgi:hypothetical protein
VTFLRGLLAARGHLAFLVGLAGAVVTIRAVDGVTQTGAAPRPRPAPVGALEPEPPLRPLAAALEARERAMARAAWLYVAHNADPATGLAPSVQGQPATTLWDVGLQLMAILAAEDLALIPEREASRRLGRAIGSLGRLGLCDGKLPNKAYDTHTLAMLDQDGRPAPGCVGWSALDVARVLAPLSLVTWRHPELSRAARSATARWRLDALTDGVSLRGAARGPDGVLRDFQEGWLGYEQLAAKDLLVWGVPVAPLLDYHSHAASVRVNGAAVPRDDRVAREHGGGRAPALSEPWVLDALENGFDANTLAAARALLHAQEARFAATGRITAVSEEHLDRAPWLSYSAVVHGDEAFTARAPDGAPAPLTFSTKAAVGWAVLFAGSYPDLLLDTAAGLVVEGEGLYAGRYDATGETNRALSLDTSAVVLEALAYRVRGPARGGPFLVPGTAEVRR